MSFFSAYPPSLTVVDLSSTCSADNLLSHTTEPNNTSDVHLPVQRDTSGKVDKLEHAHLEL